MSLLLVACWCTGTQAATFVPADFAAERPLARITITRANLPRRVDTALIRCEGFVEVDGRLTDSFCLADVHRLWTLFRKVIAVLPEQRFTPATVDGVPVRVQMNFGVAAECSAKECSVTPIRNHGYYRETYGLTYVSPQPILPTNKWYDGFDYKLMWIHSDSGYGFYRSGRFSIADRLFVVAVAIGAEGGSHGACLYQQSGFMAAPELRRDLEHVIQTIGSVRFIPGFHGNEPTAMTLYESSVADDPGGGTERGRYGLDNIQCASNAVQSR